MLVTTANFTSVTRERLEEMPQGVFSVPLYFFYRLLNTSGSSQVPIGNDSLTVKSKFTYTVLLTTKWSPN